MAITTRNYILSDFESTGAVPITDAGSGNNFFELDAYGFKFVLSDVQFWEDEAMTTEIGSGNYSLTESTTYTNKEAGSGGSGKTLYAKFQITNGTYQTGTIYVSGNSFGTFADNDVLYDLVSQPLRNMPFGEYKPLDLDNPLLSAYPLPSEVLEANGQLISDSDSPYDGYRIRNFNGADVVLTLTWTADAGGAYATVADADLPALAVGDWVTGSGIASDTMIKDISGTTVTITDEAADGEIESTFNNDGLYISGGPTSGVSFWDQMQRIKGETGAGIRDVSSAKATRVGAFTEGTSVEDVQGGTAGSAASDNFDSADSPDARTSSTTAGRTRPHTMQMVVVTRIK